MERRPTIVIVDDHPLAREGVKTILAADGFEVVGEAASGEDALACAHRLRPDLVLMDIRLSGPMDGLAAVAELKALVPATRILMLTLHDTPDYVRAALAAGATGYVLKDATREELRDAVTRVLADQIAVPAELMTRAMARPLKEHWPDLSRLTAREREVLALIAAGMTNKAIGRALDISPATAKAHVERILAKLGVADRTQAAVLAAKLGAAEGGE